MIRFNCMYCGELISAEGVLIGKKIKCSGCGHSLVIRRKESGDTQKSSVEKNIAAEPNDAQFWEGKSNQEIALWLKNHSPAPKQKNKTAARQALSLSFLRYDDLTLFALSFAFVLLLWMNLDEMKVILLVSLLMSQIGILLILAMLGMVLSLLNIFVRHRKYESEKWLMLLFAVLVTAGTGAYSGVVMLREGIRWLIIFPVWNIANSLFLLNAFRIGLVNTGSITNERAGLFQVVFSVASITLLMILCERFFHLHWALTYSIAVSYTMSVLGAIQDIFGKRSTAF